VQLRMQTCSLNPCPDALTRRDELMISCSAAACSLLLYGRLLGCSLNSNGELAIGKGRSADPRTWSDLAMGEVEATSPRDRRTDGQTELLEAARRESHRTRTGIQPFSFTCCWAGPWLPEGGSQNFGPHRGAVAPAGPPVPSLPIKT
jgi:hypothetical protein